MVCKIWHIWYTKMYTHYTYGIYLSVYVLYTSYIHKKTLFMNIFMEIYVHT